MHRRMPHMRPGYDPEHETRLHLAQHRNDLSMGRWVAVKNWMVEHAVRIMNDGSMRRVLVSPGNDGLWSHVRYETAGDLA